MSTQDDIEDAVLRYGETYRELITSALTWLDSEESSWNLDLPFCRADFIRDIIEHVAS